VAINTGGSLTAASWSTSKSTAGATGASYVYAFTAATSATNIRTVTMTVPAGTAGTASLGTVTPAGMTGGTISLSGGVLTYSFTANHTLDSGTAVSIQINGLTNTATPGSYPSEIVTKNSGQRVDSGLHSGGHDHPRGPRKPDLVVIVDDCRGDRGQLCLHIHHRLDLVALLGHHDGAGRHRREPHGRHRWPRPPWQPPGPSA